MSKRQERKGWLGKICGVLLSIGLILLGRVEFGVLGLIIVMAND